MAYPKKGLILTIIAIIAIGLTYRLYFATKKSSSARYTIGILQTASHPALDAARDGFIGQLKLLLKNDVEFIVKNAEGNISHAHTIAQRFHADKAMSAMYAIATPAAQALATVEKEKPIFIAAVTDPQALGFIHPSTNVTGASDMINIEKEIEMLVQLLPSVKTVALLYSSAEINSVVAVKKMKLELEKKGITPIELGISNEADIPTAVITACRKADALLAPTDNAIASAMPLVASLALNHKKPLLVSHNPAVKEGALAARGVDYNESGKQVAKIAYTVLVGGKKPYELPIEDAETDKVFVNKKTLDALGLTIPDVLKDYVVFV